ncbi:MAG TPA: hypothetical protein VN781_02320 [Acidimicrobiales bacterium]|nr:hypothetical protein [Acidimicrobiales bacterium]
MPDPVWDPSGKARDALHSIVSDFGMRALSSPSILDNVLHDLLPDSPKQISLIVAAGGSTVASALQEHVTQGMDADSAVRLAASQLAEQTPYDAAGCRWVTGEFARALGYPVSDEAASAGPIAPSGAPTVAPPARPLTPVMPEPETVPPRPDQAETVLPPVAPVGAGGGSAPRRSRTVPALIAAAIVVLGGLTLGAALGHIGPFQKSGSTTASLRRLLPNDARGCTTKVSTIKTLQGLSSVLGCNESTINGVVFAYQFDSSVDYQASLTAFNKGESFDPSTAAATCPPKQAGGDGVTSWHSKLYPSLPGQRLECFSVSQNGSANSPQQPTYIWTAPSENAIFQAVGGTDTSMSTLDTWWTNHAGPFNK